MGHLDKGGNKHSAIKAPTGGGLAWKARKSRSSSAFPADEDNPTPEELEEIRLRTLEVQSLWSDEERTMREPYDPDAPKRVDLRCYRINDREQTLTYTGSFGYDPLIDANEASYA